MTGADLDANGSFASPVPFVPWACSGEVKTMAKLTKSVCALFQKVDGTKRYSINEAIALLKELATAKFVESVDVAVNLGIDARKSDQNVRGATVLPHGTGRSIRVAMFTQGANAEAAKAAGADLGPGMDDLAELVKKAR